MQQIKLIALDLDGTALNDKSHLPDYTREVLEQAAETGIRLVIASGRAYSSLPEEVLNLKGLAYAITSNGAATYDMKKKERSFAFPMEENKVEALLDLLNEEPETAIEVFWEGNPYASRDFLDHPTAYGAPERAVPYLQRTRTPVPDILAFVRNHRKELDALDLICQGPLDKVEWFDKINRVGGL